MDCLPACPLRLVAFAGSLEEMGKRICLGTLPGSGFASFSGDCQLCLDLRLGNFAACRDQNPRMDSVKPTEPVDDYRWSGMRNGHFCMGAGSRVVSPRSCVVPLGPGVGLWLGEVALRHASGFPINLDITVFLIRFGGEASHGFR